MYGNCEWCEDTNCKVGNYDHDLIGEVYVICEKCSAAADNGECIKCGTKLYAEAMSDWICFKCHQVRHNEDEKHKNEIMQGLGIIDDLTHSVVFTERDYEQWVTFGQGNFSAEAKRRCRLEWMRQKLVGELGWNKDTFNDNAADIEWLMDNYSRMIFSQSCTIIINDGGANTTTKLNKGYVAVTRGNVAVLENDI